MNNINPFDQITERLDKLERMIKKLQPEGEAKKRYVSLPEFATYSGMSVHTVYSKISKGERLPGSFKAGPKNWLFDLDAWDQYLEKKKAEFQPVE